MNKLIDLWPQIYKFLLVGGLNTTIHFAIYNVLILLTDIKTATGVAIFTTVAFIFSNINSYFFNKNWTFRDNENQKEVIKFSTFFLVSLVGYLINIVTVYSITEYIPDFLGVPIILHAIGGNAETLWLNVALLAAIALSLVWNFFGYKYLVFQK